MYVLIIIIIITNVYIAPLTQKGLEALNNLKTTIKKQKIKRLRKILFPKSVKQSY